jgi:hypothetical protein
VDFFLEFVFGDQKIVGPQSLTVTFLPMPCSLYRVQ